MPRTLARSFAGGEVTPRAAYRFDLARNQTGLARVENFTISPLGPADNRAGFGYVNHAKYYNRESRIIEFSFNTEQTYILEIGHEYIRVHTGGATLLDATSFTITGINHGVPATVTAPGHTFSNGQWVFIDNVEGMTAINGRFFKIGNVIAGVSFRLYDWLDNPIDTTLSCYEDFECTLEICPGKAERVLEIATPYQEADVPFIKFAQDKDVLTLTHSGYSTFELQRAGPTTWNFVDVSFLPTIATPASAPSVSAVVGSNGAPNPITHSYRFTAVAEETLEESLPSPITSVSNDLAAVGNRNVITVPTQAGAIRYNVYKLRNGLFAFIAQTEGGAGREVTDDNLAPDFGKTAPFCSDPIDSPGNFPSTVTYFEGRRVFAGTTNRPQHFWATVSGTTKNLNYSIPGRDDDAIYGVLNSNDAQQIRHLLPLAHLVILTANGEWKTAPANSDFLTPNNAFPKQDGYEGASHTRPVRAGNSAIYVHDASNRPRRIEFRWQNSGYVSEDLAIYAPHLFDGKTTIDLAYQKAPTRYVWAVRSDGVLLGNTYYPDHEVIAWHQHTTQGEFKSVACVKEDVEFPVYAVVKRTINGVDQYLIERQRTREITAIEDSFFVDSGITYDGETTSVVGGLWHLVGEEVAILADGSTHPRRVVNECGQVELIASFSKVHIGLPYRSILATLPASWEGMEAVAQSYKKNVSDAYLRVYQTAGMKAGPALDRLREFPPRSNEDWDEPTALKNALQQVPTDFQWTDEGQTFVVQDDPLPATVLGWVLDVTSEVG